ncbi:GTP cyclohydrolase 1 [Tetrabaena socialis]|uniref:GTP cyclohydrolase 1 n=1 Tax=Tetrabaena socialis TaxID=47790 RepID=A0A2J8AHQ8_9CHLO|nr:GTP cyclohydrolase 1 [Tetrabaena socialis]|eukprot:PNH12046.1 GTP cyclohydrolase 1 [Tetrabaena socialis]
MSPRCERDREKLARMEQAVRVLIRGLGEDLEREGLRDTPKRVAKALLDCTQGYHQDTSRGHVPRCARCSRRCVWSVGPREGTPSTAANGHRVIVAFPLSAGPPSPRAALCSTLGTALFHEPIVHSGDEGVVLVRDIDFASTSEETLLPFHGRCHVAYRPKNGVVLGLSKLARLAKQFAKRLQTQERLASDIAVALQQSLDCHGVAVVLQARHLCNTAPPEGRIVACVSGVFATKHSAHLEVCGVEKDTDGDSDDLVLEAPCCCEEMEGAVQQLLAELGEDPHRAGLAGSARRYVMSLLASTSGYQQQRQGQRQQQGQQGQQAVALGGGAAAGRSCCAVASVALGAGQRGAAALHTPADGAGHASHAAWPGARCTSRACGCTLRSSGGGSSNNGAGRMEASCDACCTPAAGLLCKAAGAAAARVVPRGPSPLRGAVTLRLPFASQCEHHMLPFYGNLMVSYIPHGDVAGSTAADGLELPHGVLEQVVSMYTQRLQVQERITHQVADAVADLLRPAAGGPGWTGEEAGPGAESGGGVMVVCDAAHMCMVARGVENHSGSTTSFAVRGAFAGRPELRSAVLRLFREQCWHGARA